MPTYQYACTECGEQLEVVQSFSDAALTECLNCHGKLRKVFNSVGIVFKGSGFYRTDSRAGDVGTDKPGTAPAEATPKKAETPSSSSDSSSSSSSSTASSGSTTSSPSSSGSGSKASTAS